MMGLGHSWLFWVALGVASGSVAAVVAGIGWLLGRQSAFREARAALTPLNDTLDRVRKDMERECAARHSCVREWGGW